MCVGGHSSAFLRMTVKFDTSRKVFGCLASETAVLLPMGHVKLLYFMSIAVALLGGILLGSSRPVSLAKTYAPPPTSILICGLADRPCVTYLISFHQPTTAYGDSEGEGVTDYGRKTISIAQSHDRFRNVQALQHEVLHAVLWERNFHDDTEKWDLHAWIYFSEGVFPLLLHDNPGFVRYVTEEY